MVLLAQDKISSSSTRVKISADAGVNHGCSKLYIGNLCMDVSEEDLRGFFVDLGVVSSSITKMVVKKGFAFVEFANQVAADKAMDLCDGKPLMNTLVRIEPSIRSEQINPKPRKLVQLLFTNCCQSMTPEDVKSLLLESRISLVTIEAVRSGIQGSSSFVVRVATLKQAQQIVSEWNKKIVGGSRMQIAIMEESFSDGAGGDTYQHQPFQNSQYIPRNAVYPGSSPINEEQQFPVENEEGVQLPLRILIPNEFIGAIIGRGGATIRAISKGTGARVDIFRNPGRSYDMPEKPISIIGASENATQACKKVMEIISQEAVHQRGRGDREMIKEDASPVALKMFLPNSVVGRIIGKAGAVIKQIMEDTQTKIHISSQPDVVDQNMGILRSNRIVTIRGTIEGLALAESVISSKLREAYVDGKVRDRDLEFANVYCQPQPSFDNHTPAFTSYYSPNQSYTPATNGNRYPVSIPRTHFPLSLNSSHEGISLSRPETSYMYVPDESVGALIGRNGSSIREIIHSSGASIKVLEGVVIINTFPFRRVVIHGGVDSLFLAEYLIYNRVVDDKGMLMNSMEELQLTIEMTVPSDVVGRLIGKGGANIREIQRQNYCHVKFLTEPDLSIPPPGEGETYVRITGTAHGFLNAQKRIRTLLVKAMSKAFSMSNNDGNDESRNESPEEEFPLISPQE